MSESEERRFAHGTNEFNVDDECVTCPALTAGVVHETDFGDRVSRTPKGPVSIYDGLLAEEFNTFGVVDEEEAKEAWIQALWTLAYEIEAGTTDRWGETEYENGVEIAEELGWL